MIKATVESPAGYAISQTEAGHDPPKTPEDYWRELEKKQERRRIERGPWADIAVRSEGC